MKALLTHNWQVKVLFLAIWVLIGIHGLLDRTVDYTHAPAPPWLFFGTLPSFVICLAWATQGEIVRSGLEGFARYGKWVFVVVVDILAFTLLLAILIVGIAFTGLLSGEDYTRRSYNSEMILAASPLRTTIQEAANKSGTFTGSGKGLSPPAPSKMIDFGYVSDDGVIILHSHKTESTAFLIPRMENGKATWYCRGFPESAIPGSCRGGYLQGPAASSTSSAVEKFTCPDPDPTMTKIPRKQP
jgi:type II secretory pathway pseudopilin PulG